MLSQAVRSGLATCEQRCKADDRDTLRLEYSRLFNLVDDKEQLRKYLITECPTVVATLAKIRHDQPRIRNPIKRLHQLPDPVSDLDLDIALGPDAWTTEHFLRLLEKLTSKVG
jgi:hypothetical protein